MVRENPPPPSEAPSLLQAFHRTKTDLRRHALARERCAAPSHVALDGYEADVDAILYDDTQEDLLKTGDRNATQTRRDPVPVFDALLKENMA